MTDVRQPELREIPGFPGYFVGDDGSVWTSKLKGGNDRTPGRRGPLRRLKIYTNSEGYCFVGLDVDGKNRRRPVHQLVLEAFVGPKPAGAEACHYPDHDKSNNRLWNLRWDSHRENMRDAYRDRPAATTKTCRRCGAEKPVGEFYTDKRASDGLKTECKPCHKLVSVSTLDREKRRVANREYMRTWRAARKSP